MNFLVGFSDNCLIQRDKKNRCEQIFEGTCESEGAVLVTVSKNGRTVPGFKKLKAGKAANGKFSGVLKGLPVSTVSYDLEFSIIGKRGEKLESADIKNVLVGDLWLLGGQSNMQGYGNMEKLPPVIKEVRAYYMNDKWNAAKDPIHNIWQAKAPVHGGNPDVKKCPNPHKGTGPGVFFGQEMFRRTNIPQGLISCGHGGTTMSQWNPELKNLGGRSFYGAMIDRFQRLGGKVAGMIWYQGCSDVPVQSAYTDKMINFVDALRKDTKSPNLPIVIVQIATYAGDGDGIGWTSVREQQRLLPSKIRNLLTVPAIDLELDDPIHVSSAGHGVLGRRLAEAMLSFSDKNIKPPIELASFKILKDKNVDVAIIKVNFKNVSGKLVSAGRPTGFTFVNKNNEYHCIFKTVISGDSEIELYTFDSISGIKTHSLAYGFGLNPYCNISDSSGRPLPAFNVKICPGADPITEFINDFDVSAPVYTKETEESMAYPENIEQIDFVKAAYGGFFVAHPEREKLATSEEKIFYFKCTLNCPEDMKIKFLLGYDGPVKMFCDKKEIFKDMKGINPLLKDMGIIPAKLKAGNHDILVSLASNKGMAWGVCLRIERTDSRDEDALPVSI